MKTRMKKQEEASHWWAHKKTSVAFMMTDYSYSYCRRIWYRRGLRLQQSHN